MGDYMEIYTVSFFGHRELSDGFEIEKELEKLVRELIRKKEYIDFLVGCNGEFDTLVSSVIRRIMKENDYGNASHILVLPYQTAEYRDNAENLKEYYTEIEICGQSAAAHFRSAFQIRNRAMVDRSNLVVCFIRHKNGGAYSTVEYAKKQNKRVYYLNYEDNTISDNSY